MNLENNQEEINNPTPSNYSIDAAYHTQLNYSDTHELTLLANDFRREKKIGKVQPEQLEAEIQRLKTNFDEIKRTAEILQENWAQSENKLAARELIAQFERKLQNTDALGDYSPIKSQLALYQSEIDEILQANAAARQQISDSAKALAESTDWQQTTEQFKALLEQWKSAPETNKKTYDKLWNEISEAKNTFFDRKRKHFEEQEKEQMLNLDRKIELCEKAEQIKDSEDWKKTTDAYIALMDEWKTIGLLPSAEKNDEMWERFSAARKHFFNRKQEHSKNIREEQQNNYTRKLAIVEEAEQISTSTQWKTTTDRLDELQKSWDSIGRAPKEHNDELWKRWRAARNKFYDARRNQAKDYLKNLQENYDRKKVLTERAEHLSKSDNWNLATDELIQMMTEWKTIGPVPKEHGDDLWNRFNQARKLFFKRKDEDRDKRRARFEQKANERLQQAEKFLQTLQAELKEDEEQLAEFTQSIKDIKEENKKDKELKEHLAQLITKLEQNIVKRKAKITEVEAQLAKQNNTKNEANES